ncbi:MAG: Type IV secretory pathway VirB4 components-like protein [Candidatus Berkelbacteria bacterium Licking1014_96]|uniref:Type IV secretory pathway VirB4 components-like protein n=1 Tax=Candidatus Berkelbacteria bacterium Licking1014_96 TaxID=2017149 RepID=A0A554LF10_9BACT|nr:MAG: Type IV secretory pathway VirB4 components-like protein [Candidatus Berkelbacteria bacterium Licking1014_96]
MIPHLFESKEEREAIERYRAGLATERDLIAPAAMAINANFLQINNFYVKTLYIFAYPRYLNTNWLSSVINFDMTLDLSVFVYPLETRAVMQNLRKRIGQMESTWRIEREKGLVSDPELETAMQDVESLRYSLQKGEVKLFQSSIYLTLYANSLEELKTASDQLESILGGALVFSKPTFLRMEQGFDSTLPTGNDKLGVLRNLDTGSLSTMFPFTSSELTTNEGILYGINRHNNSLILFDRFNLENANAVVFAKSGAGKSYAVKLEALRYLMLDTDIIIVDPENEYKSICEAVGGTFINVSLNSHERINPFDLTISKEESADDILRSSVIRVHGLVRLMVGGIDPEEDSLLEKAIYEAYALKDISADAATQKNEPPLLGDLKNVLNNMEGGEGVANKLEKYTEGTFAGLFNKPTNIDLSRGFVVFSIRDLEEELRPIAMYLILGYIWNAIRKELRRRIMIIDEAWWMMQYEDSAKFLYALAKRARKYYLGLTIISQDVEDFLTSKYGRAVVANSSMQILLKQAPSSIDMVAEVFNLTEGEKFLLLESDVGEGLFFAGLNHVAIKIIASYTEDQLITSDPKQILAMREELAQTTGGAETETAE